MDDGQIAIIDLADVRRGELVAAARQVLAAISGLGFFQVVGHGVAPTVIDGAYRAWDSLIAAGPEARAHLHSPHPFRGWQYLDSGVQRFQACNIGSADEARALGIDDRHLDYFVPNRWPELDGFEPAIDAMFTATRQLAATIMQLFACGLGLPADHFAPALHHDVSCFAVNHYPAIEHRQGPLSLTEHADSGTLTLLHQRGDYDGLQIRRVDGTLLTVPVIEEAFVVNIGHLMARWTNDRFRATPHRVVPPTLPGATRTSLTTFHLPAIDTVIAPLPSCVGDGVPRYPPITPYEWERQFLASIASA